MAPNSPPAAPEPPPPGPGQCPNCGAAHDPYQEYCLECGRRLFPLVYGRRTEVWSRESPLWLWAALVALLLVALVAGAIVALAATGEDGGAEGGTAPVVSVSPTGGTDTIGVITQPETLTIQPPTTTILPTTTTTLPTTTLQTTTIAPTTTTAPTTWPAGRDGFTVVLKSVPTSQGRGDADAAARQAESQGLPQVGVLESSRYASLRPGYYVTFSGIYGTQAQAQNALPTARSRGFPLAYVREIRD